MINGLISNIYVLRVDKIVNDLVEENDVNMPYIEDFVIVLPNTGSIISKFSRMYRPSSTVFLD